MAANIGQVRKSILGKFGSQYSAAKEINIGIIWQPILGRYGNQYWAGKAIDIRKI